MDKVILPVGEGKLIPQSMVDYSPIYPTEEGGNWDLLLV